MSLDSHEEWSEPGRRDETLSTVPEMQLVLNRLAERMTAEGYPATELLDIRLAAEEAIANALRHGHQFDPTRIVYISYVVTPRYVLIRVQDQGPGFDPRELPDPLAPENIERQSGRGIFLMNSTMTWVKFNARGNAVTLCKKRAS